MALLENRLKWVMLGLLSLAIAGNYYAYDAIAPVARLLQTQRGFSQSQIALLNAVFGPPNIVLALVGGVLIDRIGAARASFFCATLCCIGAVLTALGTPYGLMVLGRLLFGVGEETLLIALLAGLAQWFSSGGMALAMSLLFSLARVGSYMADVSPRWAAGLYARGWSPPLWLAAGLTGLSLVAALVYLIIDQRRARRPSEAEPMVHGAITWTSLVSFDAAFWCILALNVLFASVFFPFRSTFAISFFQDAKGLNLADAGLVNSWVFFAAIFATPVFGAVADRFGRRAVLLTFGAALMPATYLILGATHWSLWITTVMMGISFSVIPAVIWPATAMLVEPRRLGTAFGLINVLQSLGMAGCNMAAGWLNDLNRAGPNHPEGYGPMLAMFGGLSFIAFVAVALLWRIEAGPKGHGLNASRPLHP